MTSESFCLIGRCSCCIMSDFIQRLLLSMSRSMTNKMNFAGKEQVIEILKKYFTY